MSKIDTSNWRKFTLRELGFKISHGRRIKKTDRIEGDVIFLTAGKENCGVVGTIGNDVEIWHKPITVDMFGNAFYHDCDCAGDDNIYAFINDDMDKFSKQYIVAAINAKNKGIFSYQDQFRQENAELLSIYLPITNEYLPDLEYMEEYMRALEDTVSSSLTALQSAQIQKKKNINMKEWRKFKISDLFDVYNGKKYPKQKRITGDLPLISTSAFNNGISDYIEDRKDSTYSNIITVAYSGSVGATFYHKNKVFVGETVIALVPKKILSEYSAIFICAILKENNKKYDYQYKIKVLTYGDDTIMLPVTANGDPDYDFMDAYIESVSGGGVDENTTIVENSIKKWKSFFVGELFDIHPTKSYKLTNAELLDGGKYPVVVNSAHNNGVGGTTSQLPTEKGNMITFSDTVDANTIFYQPNDFIGYSHVQGLYPIGEYKNCWSQYSLMFFATVFRQKALSYGFDYGHKFRRDVATKMVIFLPINDFGDPDWEYMEQYIESICKTATNTIDNFNLLLN